MPQKNLAPADGGGDATRFGASIGAEAFRQDDVVGIETLTWGTVRASHFAHRSHITSPPVSVNRVELEIPVCMNRLHLVPTLLPESDTSLNVLLRQQRLRPKTAKLDVLRAQALANSLVVQFAFAILLQHCQSDLPTRVSRTDHAAQGSYQAVTFLCRERLLQATLRKTCILRQDIVDALLVALNDLRDRHWKLGHGMRALDDHCLASTQRFPFESLPGDAHRWGQLGHGPIEAQRGAGMETQKPATRDERLWTAKRIGIANFSW